MKNKKGKKKNKMAGRSRPGREQLPEAGDNKYPTDSEVDETVELPKNENPRITEVETHILDSGIDSGRGSPGDDPVQVLATGDSQAKYEETTGDIKATTLQEDNVREEQAQRVEGEPSEQIETKKFLEQEVPSSSQMEYEPNDEVELKPESDTEAATAVPAKLEEKSNVVKPNDRGSSKPKARNAAKSVDRLDMSGNTSTTGHVEGAVTHRPEKNAPSIKHPLEFPWEFWTLLPDRPWSESLAPLGSFDTVEDFWCSFNLVRDPQALRTPVFMFKKDIRPEWEDPRNQNGGRWNLIHGQQDKAAIEVWQELTLMLIGGLEFGHLTQHLNGIYCAWRGDGLHFSIWIDSTDESIAKPIGHTIQRVLRNVLGRSYPMELMHTRSKLKKRYILMLK